MDAGVAAAAIPVAMWPAEAVAGCQPGLSDANGPGIGQWSRHDECDGTFYDDGTAKSGHGVTGSDAGRGGSRVPMQNQMSRVQWTGGAIQMPGMPFTARCESAAIRGECSGTYQISAGAAAMMSPADHKPRPQWLRGGQLTGYQEVATPSYDDEQASAASWILGSRRRMPARQPIACQQALGRRRLAVAEADAQDTTIRVAATRLLPPRADRSFFMTICRYMTSILIVDLIDAFQAGHRLLGNLLVKETGGRGPAASRRRRRIRTIAGRTATVGAFPQTLQARTRR